MLSTILESYKKTEDEGGLPFDLVRNGKVEKLLLVFYIHSIKADSVEADKMCGAYGTNLEGVGNICRMCCIPANQSDEPYMFPEPKRKTQDLIFALVKQNDASSRQKLKEMSQHEVWNCFYWHQFGKHNNAGVHGACPMETLHWIQLNMYKYDRECLFSQTGDSSKLSDNLDALAQTFGICLERQSDRSMPRTRFTDGIRGGKMQANEMSGLILLLALTLRSTAGRNLLLTKAHGQQKKHFPDEASVETKKVTVCDVTEPFPSDQ